MEPNIEAAAAANPTQAKSIPSRPVLVPLRQVAADPDVIQSLEATLEVARSGKLQSVYIIGVLSDDSIMRYCTVKDNLLLMLAGLTTAQHAIAARLVASATTPEQEPAA